MQIMESQQYPKHFSTPEYKEMMSDYKISHLAPTKKELDEFPSLKAAWEQYVIVRKLVKGE
jgi:hypothetical protein